MQTIHSTSCSQTAPESTITHYSLNNNSTQTDIECGYSGENFTTITQSFDNTSSTYIGRVRPNKSLMYKAMPCEKKAAYIRNVTVSDMESEDIGRVCSRYLQNRRGEINTRNEAIFCGTLAAAIGVGYMSFQTPFFAPLLSCFFSLNIPPNIGNCNRYRETKTGCEHFLRERLEDKFINRLSQIEYSEKGLSELKGLLNEYSIDTEPLDQYAVSKGFNRYFLDCHNV